MKKTSLIFLVLLAASLAGCGGAERKALEDNESLWESKAVHHYRFNLSVGCNCPWHEMMPLAIEVDNSEILSIVASNGGDITPYMDTFGNKSTIENLFDTVDSAISRGVYKLEVQYEVTYGFPVSIVVDPSRQRMDDAIGYYVTNFEQMP